jgi:tetratricopeptide (TPR) repeat protein
LEQSAALARQATEVDPNFTDAFNWLALAYSKLGGHLAEQETAARRAVALAPDNTNAHRQLAYLLSRKGQHAAAIAEAEQARRLAPGKNTSFLAMANTLGKAGRVDEAADYMGQLVKLQPQENFYAVWLANLERMRHRYAEARAALQPAVIRNPADIYAATDLALTHILGWGDVGAARATLKTVVTPPANSVPLAICWYQVEMLSRDPAAAVAAITAGPEAGFKLPLPPRDLLQAAAYQAAGDAAQAKTHYAAALAVSRQAIAAHADSADAHDQLALALVGLGNHADAIAAARKAVDLEPIPLSAEDGPWHVLNLAKVYAQTGHSNDAIELLRQLLDTPAGHVVSAALLNLDPAWDPIRHDPRFEALIKQSAGSGIEGTR